MYDRYGQDIISPLLNVKELREMGITLHLYVECPAFSPPFGRNELNNTFEPLLGRQPIKTPPSIKRPVIKVPK